VTGVGLNRELLVISDGHRPTPLDASSEEDLTSKLRVASVSDVVLPDVPVHPVGEVEILVVHADQNVSHHPWHLGKDPAFYLLVRNIDNLFSGPVALVCLVVAEHVGKKRGADKALCGLGVVEKSDLEWHDTLESKINLLNQFSFLPVIDIQMSSVITSLYVLKVETSKETSRVSPFS